MLKKLRDKKTAKKIWIVLAVLILPAFVLWGAGSFIRSKDEAVPAGRIFGRRISLLEYRDAYNAVRNQALLRFGENFTEMQKYLNLESEAWQRLVLLSEAKRLKIRVSDEEVVGAIESYPFFRNSKGRFDNQTYSQMLRYVFHTQERIFEEQARENLMLVKLYEKVTENIKIGEEEIKQEYQKLYEKIGIAYIASLPAEFAKEINVTGQEINAYFRQRSFEFKQPLSFNVEYIALDYTAGEETAINNKMKDISSRLRKKREFSAVAKDYGLKVKTSGFFTQTDPIPGIGWAPQISNLILRIKVGQFSNPISLDKHFYILRLKERKEPYIPDLKDCGDKVKEKLIRIRSQESAKKRIADCLKKLKEADRPGATAVDFEQIAQESGLKSGLTALFNYGTYIEGIGVSDNIWLAAKDLKEGEFSGIIKLPSGFYIVRVKEKLPVDEEKFLAQKDSFAQRLLAQKKYEYFKKFYDELFAKATGNFKISLP